MMSVTQECLSDPAPAAQQAVASSCADETQQSTDDWSKGGERD